MTRSRKRRDLVGDDNVAATISIVTAGQKLAGRYRLEKEIARGAMGIVFEAYDEELNDRKVAIKVLPPEMATNKNAIKRFKGEAIAAIDLTHNNIVRLYSFEVDKQQAFLVMELLEGKSLEDRIVDEGPLSLTQVCEIAKQAAAGLDEAHSANVVHRDVKPANLLYKDEEHTLLKVADFGIACNIRDTMTRLTGQEEGGSGTLLYIAPEQLKGKRPTAKADQYSLAATVYEALCGTPVFSGAGLSVQIMQGEPEPIADVPDGVNKVLAQALAKEPEERFESCCQFAKALAAAAVVEEEAETEAEREPAVADEPETETETETEQEELEETWEEVSEDDDDDEEESELPEPISLPKLLILIACLVALGAHFLTPLYRAHANEIECMNRLRNIDKAIEMYCSKHNGRYPSDLQDLVEMGHLKGSDSVLCPESKKKYQFAPPHKLAASYSILHLWPVCMDGKPVHTGNVCVLFGDHSIRSVSADEMAKISKDTMNKLYGK